MHTLVKTNRSLVGISFVILVAIYQYKYYRERLNVRTAWPWLIGATAFVCSPLVIKWLSGMVLNSNEIVTTILLSLNLILGNTLIYWGSRQVQRWIIRYVLLVISFVLWFILVFIPCGYWFYYSLHGQYLQADILLAIAQTNVHEASAYLSEVSWIKLGTFSIACLVLVGGGLYKMFSGGTICRLSSKWQVILLVVAVCVSGSVSYTEIKAKTYFQIFYQASNSLQSYKMYSQAAEKRRDRLQQLTNLHVTQKANGLYVLVIGESQTRAHMSLYGYERNTTPYMLMKKSSPNFIVFDNVFSNHTHTVPVLTYALSEKNQYNDVKLEDATSIIELAKAAGYTTYWISNQERFGAWDTPVAEIGSTADHQIWINGATGEISDTLYYDGTLVDYLPKEVPGEKTLVVVHLMGTHLIYKDRYPSEFAKFGNGTLVDTYDNAMLYSDKVIHDINEWAEKQPNFQAMIFMSDHGEDPEKHIGHDAISFTYQMSKIPLTIDVSSQFVQRRSDLYQILLSHKESYWTNDLLYNLMANLLGVEGVPRTEPTLDLGNGAYKLTKDSIRTLHGKKKFNEQQ